MARAAASTRRWHGSVGAADGVSAVHALTVSTSAATANDHRRVIEKDCISLCCPPTEGRARHAGSVLGLATWPSGLGKGLQSPVHGFDSHRRL